MFAASPLVAGFPLVGGLATLNFLNEAYLRFTFVTAHVFAFSGFARLGHQQQLPAEGVLRERRVGYGGERTIPTMNSFQFTRFARLSLALRAPASGFLEGIDPFEETACSRARLKRNSRRICPELAYITSLYVEF